MRRETKHLGDLVITNALNIPHRRRAVLQFFHNKTAPAGARRFNTMACETKPNECALFTNDRHPELSDLTGRLDVQCECPKCHTPFILGFWVNGKRKKSQKGLDYLRIALKPKGENSQTSNNGEDVRF